MQINRMQIQITQVYVVHVERQMLAISVDVDGELPS